MNKLNELISKCKGAVFIEINAHKNYHETVEENLKKGRNTLGLDTNPEVYNMMVESNSLVEIQFYTDTSLGYFTVFHFDLESAVDEALHILNINKQ